MPGTGTAGGWPPVLAMIALAVLAAGAALAEGTAAPGDPAGDAGIRAEAPPPGTSFEDYHHLVPEAPEDGVGWRLLGATEERIEVIDGFSHTRPIFSAAVEALDGETVRMRGYMYPVEQQSRQREFLFTALPPTCPYCLPAGAGYIVEAHAPGGVDFTWDAILLEGRLELQHEHPYGLFFLLRDAVRLDG